MGIRPDLLKKAIFSDTPGNWFIHVQGFYQSGMLLVEARDKLLPKKQMVSTQEVFCNRFTYKVAVYLLSHAIELSLKTIICNYNLTNPASPLKKPAKFSHKVIDMVDVLVNVNLLSLGAGDEEIFRSVDEYLKWYGRYYCPNSSEIDDIIKKAYTEPDKDGLIDFKYKPEYPKTHIQLIKLYQKLILPGAEKASLSLQYLLQCP